MIKLVKNNNVAQIVRLPSPWWISSHPSALSNETYFILMSSKQPTCGGLAFIERLRRILTECSKACKNVQCTTFKMNKVESQLLKIQMMKVLSNLLDISKTPIIIKSTFWFQLTKAQDSQKRFFGQFLRQKKVVENLNEYIAKHGIPKKE